MADWMDIGSIVPYHRPLVVAAQGPYGTRHMKPSSLLPLLSLLALMSVGLAVSVGSTSLRLDTVLAPVLGGGHDSRAPARKLGLRLPRPLTPSPPAPLLPLAPLPSPP